MQIRSIAHFLIAASLLIICHTAPAQTDTTFTYQGKLDFQGQPYSGTADYRFTLWSAASGGSQVGGIVNRNAVAVDAGLFTAGLDFSANPFVDPRWLEISVRTPAWNGTGAEPPFTMLTPRQALTRSPYSIQTRGITVSDAGDRIGIGTTIPAVRFEVRRDAGATETVRFADSDSLSQIRFQATSYRGEIQGWNGLFDIPSSLVFNPAGGYVGIGVATPSAAVDVNGGIRARGGPPGAGGALNNGYAFNGVGDNDSGLFSLAQGEVSVFLNSNQSFRFFNAGLQMPDGSVITHNAISGSATNMSVDFGVMGGGARSAVVGPIPGALPGDVVIVSVNGDGPYPFVVHGAYCPAPNQFRVLFTNIGTTTIDPPAFTFSVVAIRP